MLSRMTNPVFPAEARSILDSCYPRAAAKLSHGLLDHPLLKLDALVDLATALPKDSVEYNPGNIPVGIKPEDVPISGLGIAETIRSIEENGSWMVLKRIEQQPDYAALLATTLAEIEPLVAQRTGNMLGREGFIFISSPGSVTPFHFDPEHNILLQVRGTKTMTVFSAEDDDLVRPEAHEKFHLGQHHRNQHWEPEFAEKGQPITIIPGEAIYVPVKAPHWVQNGPEVSISLSITWRSDWSYSEADARAFNHMLRKAGLAPRNPAPWPSRNLRKSVAYRALAKAQRSLGLGKN
jgi:oxalate decarboxylase/phosphoglucose isomerase-like protein (cupin superfamily)